MVSLPALPFTTAAKGSEVLWKLYEKFPEIQKEFSDNHIFVAYTSDPYHLLTTDKQVKKLEDLKGLKIRVTGGPPTDQMKAYGATPMLIPMPDNYMALQKGVTDGMGAPYEARAGLPPWRSGQVPHRSPPVGGLLHHRHEQGASGTPCLPTSRKPLTRPAACRAPLDFGRGWFDTAKDAFIKSSNDSGKKAEIYSLPAEERARCDRGGRQKDLGGLGGQDGGKRPQKRPRHPGRGHRV